MIDLECGSVLTNARIYDYEKETAHAIVKLLEGKTVAEAESLLLRLAECIKMTVII